MKWLDVLEADTPETVYVCGYECSNCGYLAMRKWVECPHCHEEWIPDSTEEYEEAMKQHNNEGVNNERIQTIKRHYPPGTQGAKPDCEETKEDETMNGRQAAKAAAKRITELEYVNAMQAQDIKDYHKVIWDMIAGESPCTYCESFEECQREVKAGKGCQEWWLRFRKDGDPDGQETGTGTDSVLSVAKQ